VYPWFLTFKVPLSDCRLYSLRFVRLSKQTAIISAKRHQQTGL